MKHEIKLILPPKVVCTCGIEFALDEKYPVNWQEGLFGIHTVHRASIKEVDELRFKQESSGE